MKAQRPGILSLPKESTVNWTRTGAWILLSSSFLLFSFRAVAQKPLSFAAIDSLSYKAYLNSDWKQVRSISRSGLRSGIDYYYLRMRIGIAELNLNRPVRAAIHFRKALEFNQNDPKTLEYLYSSILYSGDLAECRLLATAYSSAFRKRMGIPSRRVITGAFIEPGYMVNTRAASLKAVRPDAELSHLYLVPIYWYLSGGIRMEPGNRFSATISANILHFNAIQQFLVKNQTPLVYDVNFNQKALYVAADYYLGKGFHLDLAGQIMQYTLPLFHRIGGNSSSQYLESQYAYNDLALNASVVKRFPYVTVALSADVNRFKNDWIRQATMELTLYPAGNMNTYLEVSGTLISDSVNSPVRIISHARAGRKIFHSVWIEGEYYYGNIRNYSEHNAYVVYNNFDLIRNRIGVNLLAYSLLPHIDISLRYQYTLRTASWQIYQNSEYIRDLQQDYPVHSIIGGLTWRF